MQTFVAPFTLRVDDPTTLDEARSYLAEALEIDLDADIQCPGGSFGAEVDLDQLVEVDPPIRSTPMLCDAKLPQLVPVAEFIRLRIEPDEPQTSALAFLKSIDGKRINKTHLAKLNAQVPGYEFRLRYVANMTNLEWGGYGRANNPDPGGSLLLAYTTVSVVVDAAWVEEHNTAYFSAAVERNKARQQTLAQPAKCQALDQAIADYLRAKEALKALLADPLFRPDSSAIETHLVGGDIT
jgi:hypothetical protein